MARHPQLPQPLSYLQPFADSLVRRPADDLNEDVDPEPLIAAVRERFQDEEQDAAEAQFQVDIGALSDWLETAGGPSHPAHWIGGFLSNASLDELFEEPAEVGGPAVVMEIPAGWQADSVARMLSLTRPPVFATITALDEFSFRNMRQQWDAPPADVNESIRLVRQIQAELSDARGQRVSLPAPPQIVERREFSDVSYGAAQGRKFIYEMTNPSRMRQVSYLLTVPGGQVYIQMGATPNGEFDETPLEERLATLRIVPPV
jgi:hypothetical protein